MNRLIYAFLILGLLSACNQSSENPGNISVSVSVNDSEIKSGIITIQSEFMFDETIIRLDNVLTDKGFNIIAVVPHSKAAHNVGIEIMPATLFIFGNPKIGSKLMKCNPTVALDLPQRMLIWENIDHEVMLTYNDPVYLQERHELGECAQKVIQKISKGLAGLAKEVTKD
jgi:uncharacterized protein (DUF302 family)